MNSVESKCNFDCPRLAWVFRLLVFAQFLLAAMIVLLLTPDFSNLVAAIVSLAGILFGIWAAVTMGRSLSTSPRLKDTAQLKTGGPFRIVRHPMYAALLMFCGGFVIADGSIFAWLLWISLAIILSLKIYYEEQMLRERFPEYEQYSGRVKRLIPFVY